MGATAVTVAPGEQRTTATVALGFLRDRRPLINGTIERQLVAAPGGVELETRIGVTPRSDVGLRITGLSEVLLSYKHRVVGTPEGAGIAAQLFGGAAFQGVVPTAGAIVVASSDDRRRTAVFGGVRLQALKSLSDEPDLQGLGPEVGAFLGWQLRRGTWVLLPELAVLKGNNIIRGERTLIVVPAITFRRERPGQ